MLTGDYYTWKEFTDAVRVLLPLDNKRVGASDYVTRLIRLGVLDLQNFIPAYRKGHEDLYLPCDFVTEGAASRGVRPPQAAIQDAFLFNANTQTRYPVNDFPWANRFELVNALVDVKHNNAYISFDPSGENTFYVFPEVTDGWILSLNWDGVKLEFTDNDHTPFDEQMTQVVADFVRGRIARDIEKDMTLYESYFHPRIGSYSVGRRNLYLKKKDETRTKS